VANIKAQLKRGLLQWIYDGVKLQTIQDDLGTDAEITTLEEGLMWFQRYVANDVKGGKLTTGSSGYQHAVTFAKPEIWRSLTPDELFAGTQELREVYADAVVTLSAQSLQTSDINILAVMLADDRLQTVNYTQKDYTVLRMPWVRLS